MSKLTGGVKEACGSTFADGFLKIRKATVCKGSRAETPVAFAT
jgi:hypothetical protein